MADIKKIKLLNSQTYDLMPARIKSSLGTGSGQTDDPINETSVVNYVPEKIWGNQFFETIGSSLDSILTPGRYIWDNVDYPETRAPDGIPTGTSGKKLYLIVEYCFPDDNDYLMQTLYVDYGSGLIKLFKRVKKNSEPWQYWQEIKIGQTSLSGYGITDAYISNGTIYLGSNTITPLTQHQDISGKADKSSTVSNVAWSSTNKKLTKTINGTTSDIVSAATLKTDLGIVWNDIGSKPTTLSGYGITVDPAPTGTSTNPVESQGIKTYVDTAETNAKADWFKLGTQIPNNSDLNTYTTPGHYYIASNSSAATITNTPNDYGGKLIVEETISSSNYKRQTYYCNTDSTSLISIRRQNSSESGWSDWITFPTPANVISSVFSTGVSLSGYNSLDNLTPGNYYAADGTVAGNVSAPYTRSGFNLWVIATTSASRRVQLLFPNPYDSEYNTKGFFLLRQEVAGTWEAWHTITDFHGLGNATLVGAAGINMDTLKTEGVWYSASIAGAQNSVGRPDYDIAGAKVWRLDVYKLYSTRPYQELTVYKLGNNEGDFDKYFRINKTDDTWTDWQHIDTTTVSTYYPSA